MPSVEPHMGGLEMRSCEESVLTRGESLSVEGKSAYKMET